MYNEAKLIFESYAKNVLPKTLNESHSCQCGCEKCGPGCPCDAACECKNKKADENSESMVKKCGHRAEENCECMRGSRRQFINAEDKVHHDDTVSPNEGPGGVLEIQPDGRHPQPPADENAEGPGGPEEDEDWKSHMTRNIVHKGSEFLRSVYELGYTGEAGEDDINEVVALLAQEAEADDRLKQAIEAVVTHMVNAGQADH